MGETEFLLLKSTTSLFLLFEFIAAYGFINFHICLEHGLLVLRKMNVYLDRNHPPPPPLPFLLLSANDRMKSLQILFVKVESSQNLKEEFDSRFTHKWFDVESLQVSIVIS